MKDFIETRRGKRGRILRNERSAGTCAVSEIGDTILPGASGVYYNKLHKLI